MTLTEEQQQAKAEFQRVRGTWSDTWEAIVKLSPAFLLAYMEFSTVASRRASLDEKTREFVFIAVDASATHMYEPGVRQHVKAALAAGATDAELMEVLACTATLSIQAATVGIPILSEVLEERGVEDRQPPPAADLAERKEEFAARHGWDESWESILKSDPALFSAYSRFTSLPWKESTLDAKTRELLYLALDVSGTHLHRDGIRRHIENALDAGATSENILEVIEIASVIGVHSALMGAPMVLE